MLRIDRASSPPRWPKFRRLPQWELDRLVIDPASSRSWSSCTWSPAGWCWPTAMSPRRTPWSCIAPRGLAVPAVAAESGITRRSMRAADSARLPSSASVPRWRGMWRRRSIGRRGEEPPAAPPAPFSDTPTDWASQQVLGARASLTRTPTSGTGPTGSPPTRHVYRRRSSGSAAVTAAKGRLSHSTEAGDDQAGRALGGRPGAPRRSTQSALTFRGADVRARAPAAAITCGDLTAGAGAPGHVGCKPAVSRAAGCARTATAFASGDPADPAAVGCRGTPRGWRRWR